MPTMISREANLPRKAMRVAIPLFVEVGGKTWPARDWSTTGVGLADLDPPPQQGDVLPAKLSFPMLESTLLIPVQLAYRSSHEGVHGFEFQDLSPRNRRILRHYIELSLDGKLGDVEDIVAVAALPAAADDRVQAPLALGSPAPLQQQRGSRIGRIAGSVLAGLLVLGAAGGILYYNLTYQLEGTGLVSGSIARVTANHDGQVGRLLVATGAKVEPGTPLFAVENPSLRNEIDALEQHVAQLAAQEGRLAGARRRAEAGLLQSLRSDYAARRQELENARKLYASGAITQRDLMMVANQAQDLRVDYLRQVAEGATRTQTLDNSDGLQRLRLELAAKKVLLAREQAERIVRAPVRGKVYHVDRQPGEFVSAQDPVVLLEADVTPSVLLRVPNDDAVKLKIGMPAQVYVPFEDRKYVARVAAVGLAATTASAAVLNQEADQNETLVKLDFQDEKVRLPANARVNVWIRNPALPWS
jgi:multidrug resistance efflux pump